MKILHIVPSYKPAYVYGGTIESVARLCEAEVQAGALVKVFTTTANGKAELDVKPNKACNVEGVSVIYFSRIFKDPFYISPALWKWLYRDCKNYDAVHIHSWWNMIVLVSAFICKIKKVKTILSPRGMMSDYILNNSNKGLKKILHLLGGKSLLKASTFHATSQAEFYECKRLIPRWKGFIIPNLIWLPELTIVKTANAKFTIVYMSRIHPKKGIELLMEAISLMQAKPVLQIAGSGDNGYIQKLKQKAKELNIDENIQWLGWQSREEKFKTLMQADIFALTSYNENFANAVIEALHAGTPVLIADTVGLSNFVAEYKLGWICKTEVSNIILKLEEAIRDNKSRERINKCGPVVVKSYLSEKELVLKYLHQYKS